MSIQLEGQKKQLFELFKNRFANEKEAADQTAFLKRFDEDANDVFFLEGRQIKEIFDLVLDSWTFTGSNHQRKGPMPNPCEFMVKEIKNMIVSDKEYQDCIIERKRQYVEQMKANKPTNDLEKPKEVRQNKKVRAFFQEHGFWEQSCSNCDQPVNETLRSNLHDYKGKMNIFPEDYQHKDLFCPTARNIRKETVKLLQEYERMHSDYLKELDYKRIDSTELTDEFVYLVARINLTGKDFQSKDFADVKIDFLTPGNKLLTVPATFNFLKEAVLYANQILIVKGRFSVEHTLIVYQIMNSVEQLGNSYPSYKDSERRESNFLNNGRAKILLIKGPLFVPELSSERSNIDNQMTTIVSKIQELARTHTAGMVALIGPLVADFSEGTVPQMSVSGIESALLDAIGTMPNVLFLYINDTKDVENVFPVPVPKANMYNFRWTMAPNPCVLDIDGLPIAFTCSDFWQELFTESLAITYKNVKVHRAECLKNLFLSRSLHPIIGHKNFVNQAMRSQLILNQRPAFFILNGDHSDPFVHDTEGVVFTNLPPLLRIFPPENDEERPILGTWGHYGVLTYEGSGNGSKIQPIAQIFQFNPELS